MKPGIEEIFEKLLTQVQSGRRIEDVLKEYPESRSELEPLLILACQVKGLPRIEAPDPKALESSISQVRRVVYELRERPRPSLWQNIMAVHPALVRVCGAALLLLLIVWGGVSFSAQSMPGNFLYPVKRLTERARYQLTFTPCGKAELHLAFAKNRTDELLGTFRAGAPLDRPLLSAMLNESRAAHKAASQLADDDTRALSERIRQVNQRQRTALEDIRCRACLADAAVLDQAISICVLRGDCLTDGCCPGCQCDSEPCGCPWEYVCRWK